MALPVAVITSKMWVFSLVFESRTLAIAVGVEGRSYTGITKFFRFVSTLPAAIFIPELADKALHIDFVIVGILAE
jgi:hypothetical protein